MFKFEWLLLITIATSDLSTTEQAYEDYLHYKTIAEGAVSSKLATVWQQPELAGKPYKIMQASSGKPTYLRFIENTHTTATAGIAGWQALEILVQDVDQLADDIGADKNRPSPFTIRGPPDWLTDKRNVRAMQVTGPAGEMLYLAEVKDPSKMLTSNQQADSYVDQVFIMVAGSRQFEQALSFYRDDLQLKPLGPFPYKIAVLAERLGLAKDTVFDLALIKVTDTFAIEMDRYPTNLNTTQSNTTVLNTRALEQKNHSPIMSISLVARLRDPGQRIDALTLDSFPYNGRPALMLTGKAGEKIEVVIEH